MMKANLLEKQKEMAVSFEEQSPKLAAQVSKFELPITATFIFVFLLIVSQPFFTH